MKKLILFAVLFLTPIFTIQAQEDNTPTASSELSITKEIALSKTELYNRTKMFISDTWRFPNSVIQNDDSDFGIIQVRSTIKKDVKVGMGIVSSYTYEFTTTFRFKDSKYRVEIKDVICTKANQSLSGNYQKVPEIPYFDGDNIPDKTQSFGKGLTKKQALKMMAELRAELKEIISSYEKSIIVEDDF